MSVIVGGWRCDECGATGLMEAEMGKFCGTSIESDKASRCGVCRRCLHRMGVLNGDGKPPRGTNRTPPKKRRKKR